ncbi:MAG: suppressor of fused domain protein [Eubacteriaceae bacterium]|nr:suppressor of fused domain protein [Eubacteriaceae bacterium]
MGIFNGFKKNKYEMYSEEELNAIDNHIVKFYGKYETVLHELVSTDIHVDIIKILPNEERNYITLVTEGMGAHSMNVPKSLKNQDIDRIELVCYLPADWDIESNDDIWYWPISCLKMLARLPIYENSWLGFGHTIGVAEGETLAENTKLTNVMLIKPENVSEDATYCLLPNGEKVLFYQMIAIYTEEFEFIEENDSDIFIEKMKQQNISSIIDINRNCCQ